MAALQTVILLMLLFVTGGSSTCTDAELNTCYTTCNYNIILLWKFLLSNNVPVMVSREVCQVRSVCYNCAKNKGCTITDEQEQLYQQYKEPCAPLYNTGRSSHDTYKTGLTASIFFSAISFYYLQN